MNSWFSLPGCLAVLAQVRIFYHMIVMSANSFLLNQNVVYQKIQLCCLMMGKPVENSYLSWLLPYSFPILRDIRLFR